MRVLGISDEDLSTVPPRSPSTARKPGGPPQPPASAAIQQRRAEIFERKRLDLLAELEATVDVLDEEAAQRILAPDPLATAREAAKVAVGRSGRAEEGETKLQALRDKTKSDVQRYVDQQTQKGQKMAEGESKREEAANRLAEMMKEQRLAREEKMKQRQAKATKKDEIIQKVRQQQREGARELMKKLQESFEKVQKHLKEKSEGLDKVREERHQKLEGVSTRRTQAALAAQEEMVRLYLEKEQRTMQRLEEQREKTRHRAVAEEGKYTEKLEALSLMIEKRQADKEATFRKTAEDLVRAQKVVEDRNEERSKAAREALEKRFLKKDQVLTNKRKERFEKRKGILDKLAAREALSPREKLLAEETRRRSEQRELMQEVVAQNQQRLDRANEFAREQMLARIQQNSARVDSLAEQRQQQQLQRAQLMKESLIERNNVHETLRTMKVLPRPESPPQATEAK